MAYSFRWFAALLLMLALVACDDLIEFSPYEVETSERHLTEDNLRLVAAQSLPHFEPFRFAVVADTHAYYEQLQDAVASINRRDDLAFVLHAGDLTDFGYLREFEWTIDLMQGLRLPWLTVSGNHDALNNGKANYAALFGPQDYLFTYNGVKLVALNSNNLEFDNQVPRLDWLEQALGDGFNYTQLIVLTHISPWDERFDTLLSNTYLELLRENNVALLIAGHGHAISYREELLPSGGKLRFLINGTVKDRLYHVISVEHDNIAIERVNF